MVKEKACKTCHLITAKDMCPKCKTHTLSDDYSGIIIVLDPKNSELAKRLNFDVPGKYALRVR
jgi:DNA-directed RNA polymerase subunit E"